ncbi:MAG: hypothetical protein OEY03_02035 [Rhizobacter sp.]|nr:hypothetical protein [Rhizobacter sp.]
MNPELHTARSRPIAQVSLWLVTAALLVALALLLNSGSSSSTGPVPAAEAAAAPTAQTAPPIDHSSVVWKKSNVEPDPSPASIAAYGD